jgi:hypothetical protein
VHAQPPRSGVSARRNEVLPVLRDEPDPRAGDRERGEPLFDPVKGERPGEGDQDHGTQVPFMNARAQDVDPRAQAMTLDPQHDPATR